MKGHNRSFRKFLDQSFDRFQKLPAVEAEPAWQRLLDRRRDNLEGVFEGDEFAADSIRLKQPVLMRRPLWAAATASLVFAVVLSVAYWPAAPAVVQSVGLQRVVDGKTQALEIGEKIAMGDIVRSDRGAGGTVVLADTSRVEMRSEAEFSIERATDGIRIHLRKGSLIVNAAKQQAGHLYVQTKEVTVSVVGTVFLVNAEEEGSRVAVIEGEVRVRQGETEKNLRPGEQMTTNPKMESHSVKEEVAWSRHAEAHEALLQQSAVPLTIFRTQSPTEPQLAFDLASIRPSNLAPSGGGGRGGAGLNNGCGNPPLPQVDPRRFQITNITLYNLVGQAYPSRANATGGCLGAISTNILSGGPGWVKSDQWDIQALIPQGTPGYTRDQFMRGEAPELHRMLQTLLAVRFQLVLRRETRDMPVYLLTVGKGGPRFNIPRPQEEIDPRAVFSVGDKIMGAAEFKEYAKTLPPPARGGFLVLPGEDQNGNHFTSLSAGKMSMSDWAAELFALLDRPVLDRTGLSGRYEFRLEYDEKGVSRPTPIRAHEEQLGLRLEPATAPVEVWVIERAARPSEN